MANSENTSARPVWATSPAVSKQIRERVDEASPLSSKDLADWADHAEELEAIIRDASAALDAIGHGSLLSAAPADPEAYERHSTASNLIYMAAQRLRGAEAIQGTDLSIKLRCAIDGDGEVADMGKVTATPSRSAWETVMKAEQFARSTMDQFSEEFIRPVTSAHESGNATQQQIFEAEEAWSAFTDAHDATVNALILTPAPDLSAVLTKLELAIKGDVISDEQMLQAIADDVRRLGRPA